MLMVSILQSKGRVVDWTKKQDFLLLCAKTHFIDKDKHWLRLKEWKKISATNGCRKQAGKV
jgi:hypothetical protein